MKMTNTRLIALSFALTIILGTVLLCLPISSTSGEWTNPVDALFTATTSTCVTGLVVFDTATQWSLFGEIVILVLIQIGGIGLMTLITMFSFFVRQRVSLHERRLLLQSAGALNLGGVTSVFKQVLLGTLVIEGVGAALLSVRFCRIFGAKGIWYSVFHSVSAFCNAGIDLLGDKGSMSFIAYQGDWYVNFVLMFLIVVGGLGFLVWSDLLKKRFRFKKLELHSKFVLTITAVLIVGGWGLIYLTERNTSMAELSEPKKLLASLFQSVTTRTAGMMTTDQATISNSGMLVSMVLMFIGGSPGSTAGGAKTTTVAIFLLCCRQLAHNREDVVIFKRRIDDRIVRQAGAVVCMYLGMMLVATGILCAFEPFGLRDTLYETLSAIATVGLSTGITSSLCVASKLVLILLMYAGRLGGLSLFLALSEGSEQAKLKRPIDKILIG
ncbi:MAG: Trk family potassium uptake protein [Clostridia bacterium]|nr:Trk family potassium uptake protein [Clostridia bacterium]